MRDNSYQAVMARNNEIMKQAVGLTTGSSTVRHRL